MLKLMGNKIFTIVGSKIVLLYQDIKETLKTLSAEGFETQMAGSCDNWFLNNVDDFCVRP